MINIGYTSEKTVRSSQKSIDTPIDRLTSHVDWISHFSTSKTRAEPSQGLEPTAFSQCYGSLGSRLLTDPLDGNVDYWQKS